MDQKLSIQGCSMGLETLRQDYGDSLSVSEVAVFFGVDRRTVQKYPARYGGVEVAPGRLRFFENLIRDILNANKTPDFGRGEVACRGEDKRQAGGNKDVRNRPGAKTGGNAVGDRDTQAISQSNDPYNFAECFTVGK